MVLNKAQLMSLVIGIHMVAAPVYSTMPVTILLLALTLTVYAGLIIKKRVGIPGKMMRGLMVVAVLAGVLFSYGTILGQMPGTSMVILLSFMKLFEIKSQRDVASVVFLGYFIIATSFFHTQSPLVALYVFVVVIYLTSILILFSDRLSSFNLKQRLRLSTRMVLLSVPVMIVLFVLFPRVSGPLWGLPEDANTSLIGIDDEMSPGSINRLISSGAVAFRVKFDGEVPSHVQLYWRGLVLSDYDGKTWRRDDAPISARPIRTDYSDSEISYTVTLQPHNEHWLFALEQLVGHARLLGVSREYHLFARNRVTDAFSYDARASLQAKNNGLFEQERIKNLGLPSGINEASNRLALDFRQRAGDNTQQLIQLMLEYFRNEDFYYTLSPPLLAENAVDDFLFNTRRGFCEHYASAFVYLMRAAGVPARVVVGYQGGEVNPVDDYMIVRQSDAHAWAEVWNGKHWQRVDPTHAVSPQRIERGIQNAGLERDLLPPVFLIENQYMIRARFMLDSFYNTWNQWVIGFNKDKQKEFFQYLGLENISTASLVTGMVVAMTIVCGMLAWWLFRRGINTHTNRIRAWYDVFCRKFEKAGLRRDPHEGPCEFVKRISDHFPSAFNQASVITRHYLELRYGEHTSDANLKTFIKQVKKFNVAR